MKKCWLFSSHTQGLGAKPSVLKALRYARCAIRFLLPQRLLTGALPLQWSGEWDLRLWPSLSGLAVWAAISACIWIDCLKYWEELIPTEFCEDRPAGNWLGTIKLYLFVCLLLVFFFFFFSQSLIDTSYIPVIFRPILNEAHLFEVCLWSKKIDCHWLGSTLKYFWPTFIHLNLPWLVIWIITEYFKKLILVVEIYVLNNCYW